MTVQDITRVLEQWAAPQLAESYDNVGLLVGDHQATVTKALITLDVTDAVLDEAIRLGANLVIAHHPVWFTPRKNLTERDWVGRLLRKAIRHDLNLYACHTNLDHIHTGVNAEIARRLGLQDVRVLAPKTGLMQLLTVSVPTAHADVVEQALLAAGAGTASPLYDQVSVRWETTVGFRPIGTAQPHTGAVGQRHTGPETQLQVILPSYAKSTVLAALRKAHPYEEIAWQLTSVEAAQTLAGSGAVGVLPAPMPKAAFLDLLKRVFQVPAIRYADTDKAEIRKVALCGGSGSFLLDAARAAGADAFVTADVTYHKFFDSEGHLLYCDIGHYESEQFTPHAIAAHLQQVFPTFAFLISGTPTNPVSYHV